MYINHFSLFLIFVILGFFTGKYISDINYNTKLKECDENITILRKDRMELMEKVFDLQINRRHEVLNEKD